MSCAICGTDDFAPFLSDLKDYQFGVDWKGEIRTCRCCGAIQQYPMPTQEEALAFYPEEYAHYHPDPSKLRELLVALYFRRTVALFRRLGCKAGDRLLDVGAGSGEKAAHLHRSLDLEVVCLEPNPLGAAAAREVHGLETINAFFPNDKIRPGSYSFVYINHVIEHVPDPIKLLNDINVTLAPGGWVIGETENINSLSFRTFKKYWSLLHVPYHLYFFTEQTLQGTFAHTKFERAEVEFDVDPSAWLLSAINYLRRNQKEIGAAQRIPGYKLFLIAAVPIAQLERPNGPIIRFWAQKQ